ncbi:YihY/virulence factor BrkB family protein [Specibacter sp. RAF43]|uniref:YihY/virulence factor BrkB family protein n=1 Tax=Specibacter sp. RAF43 TaxID=3233057 RepID=UPI003F9BE88D
MGSDPDDAREKSGSPAPDDPRKVRQVTDLKATSWKYVAKRTISEFNRDGGTDKAAALTYFGVLSLFPAILALVSILGLIGQAQQTTKVLLDLVSKLTDGAIVETIRGPVQQLTTSPAAGWTFAIGLVTALWSASGYVGAFSRAMNRIYGTEEGRPAWKLRPALLLVTLVAVLMAAVIALFLVVSGTITAAVGAALGMGDAAISIWEVGKWPVVAALVIFLIAILYYFTPNVRQPKFRWITVGASVAVVVMVLASAAFGIYVANFSKYEATYGTIAGMIILLLWLWLINMALVFGAEVDAELERGRQLQSGMKSEDILKLPPKDITASDKKRAKVDVLVAEGRELRLEQGNHDAGAAGPSANAEKQALWWLAGVGAVVVTGLSLRRRRAEALQSRKG